MRSLSFGLAHYDVFDPQGIAANQLGALSPEQRRVVGRHAGKTGCVFALGVLWALFIFLPVIVMLISLAIVASGQNATWVLRIGLGFASVFVLAMIVVAMVFSIRNLARALSVWLDLRAGQVLCEEGTVVWKKGYVARIAGRTLKPMTERLDAPPGSYRFFYLPRSGWLVGAEKLALPLAVGEELDLQNILARAHGFTLDQLDVNRQGRLARRQVWGVIGISWLQVLGGLFFASLGVTIWGPGWGERGGVSLVTLFLLLFVLAGLYSLVRAGLALWDVMAGQVSVTEGVVFRRARIPFGLDRDPYCYQVNGIDLPVIPPAAFSLIEGQSYRIYYLPRSKRLLSLEPL